VVDTGDLTNKPGVELARGLWIERWAFYDAKSLCTFAVLGKDRAAGKRLGW